MNDTSTIPFYGLWQNLRNQGFDIDIEAFLLLPQILTKRGVPTTATDFSFLLQKLWLKPNDDIGNFEKELNRFFETYTAFQPKAIIDSILPEEKENTNKSEKQPPVHSDKTTSKIPDDWDKIRITIRKTDETKHIKTSRETEENIGGHFLLKGNYFPVKENNLKQAGLYLKKTGRIKRSNDIDLAATVNQWAIAGGLVQPIYETQKDTHILWLIDDRGSMEPFAKMAELLIDSFSSDKSEVYYFYNSLEKIYQNREQINAQSFEQLNINANTCVFIFSDAGAAKGTMNTERFKQNRLDFERCHSLSKRTVWINPVPQKRWKRTTAKKLSAVVPMFECNRNGIIAAVKYLSR